MQNLSNEQVKSIKDIVEKGNNCLTNIYNNILAFDKAEIDKTQLALNFKNIKKDFDEYYSNFLSLYKEDSKYNKAKLCLDEISVSLKKLADEKNNCNLKYELINFAINYSNILSCFC